MVPVGVQHSLLGGRAAQFSGSEDLSCTGEREGKVRAPGSCHPEGAPSGFGGGASGQAVQQKPQAACEAAAVLPAPLAAAPFLHRQHFYFFIFAHFSCLEARCVCRQAAIKAANILLLIGLARSKQDPINRGHGAQYLYRPPPAGATVSISSLFSSLPHQQPVHSCL